MMKRRSYLTAILACGSALCALLGLGNLRTSGQPAPAAPTPASPRQPAPTTRPAPSVRCAVIGGMADTGFWPALAERFEKQTEIHVEVAASGPKEAIDEAFRRGGIDLITMHASDTIINLVADGWADDPQPWMRNDLVIVGPPDDPAGIKGQTDAAAALKKIADAKANFVVHASLGAQEVLRAILDADDIALDPQHTQVLFEDRQRRVLSVAAQKKAYTLVGRIPFRNGKLPNEGLAVMVQGDPRLRRPYLVAVANASRVPGAHVGAARRLAAFLRSPETQQWIAGFGKGKLDDLPIFFPVNGARPTTRPAGARLTVTGEIAHPLALTAEALAALPHREVKVKDRAGKEVTYSGVPLAEVLKEAGAPQVGVAPHSDAPAACVVAEAPDGFRAVFSLVEFDPARAGSPVLLADRRDGRPLEAAEGPLRLVVPEDARPVRWVRQVASLRVVKP